MSIRYALSVFNPARVKKCELYDSTASSVGEATDICIKKELGGWKEVSFRIPVYCDNEENYRCQYVVSENLVRVIEGSGVDWYIIQKPERVHDKGKLYLNVSCAHLSSQLKTRGLYTYFDGDTNGIGTVEELILAALGGSGWEIGVCDTLYEADGTTEKIRTYKCDTKTGVYNMIAGICDLFFCHPVYHGDTKRVDIRANAVKDSVTEIVYGYNSNKLTRTPDSDSLVTRLYVEGDYGQDEYVGIEDVNPTGLSYIFNFDYFRGIGAFTSTHEAALATYLSNVSGAKTRIRTNSALKVSKETDISNKFGSDKFVYYTVSDGVATPVYYGNGAELADSILHVTDTIAAVKADGHYTYPYPSTEAASIVFPVGTVYAVKVIRAVYGTLGGKEVAVAAKNITVATLQEKKQAATEEIEKVSLQEQIDKTLLEIASIQNGTHTTEEDIDGMWDIMLSICTLCGECTSLIVSIAADTALMASSESAFSSAIGDMLKDGYWNDTNYVVGQEQTLYADAVAILAKKAFPVVTYTVSMLDMYSIFGESVPIRLNMLLHIIDETGVNDNAFVKTITVYPQKPEKNTIEISTDDLNIAGKTLNSVLSEILSVADKTKENKTIYERASALGRAGELSSEHLDGQIDIIKNKLASTSSSWITDDYGNMIFTSLDGKNAMMLCGSGFMCASGKDDNGNWKWRTFGTGDGFTADLITAGVLKAGIITILGSDRFYWDAENIYIFDTDDENVQIRIGKYDGAHYGIGYTQDNGATWNTAIGFDGVHFSVSQENRMSSIETSIGTLSSRMSTAELAIKPDSIVSTVTNSDVYKNDKSALQGSINDISGTVATQQTQIQQLSDEIDVTVKKDDMNIWLRIDAVNGVEIGRRDNNVKMSLDNTGWKVTDSGLTTAECRDSKIFVKDAVFDGSMMLGNFLFRADPNTEHLSLLVR